MAKKLGLLVDTDILIDYFNHRFFQKIFGMETHQIYYSVVTKKELLTKEGLNETEEDAIRTFLKRHRIIPLDSKILEKYSDLRKKYPSAAKEDALIASTAIIKKLPLLTRNVKHFRIFPELKLYVASA